MRCQFVRGDQDNSAEAAAGRMKGQTHEHDGSIHVCRIGDTGSRGAGAGAPQRGGVQHAKQTVTVTGTVTNTGSPTRTSTSRWT